jgi:hypothetical protein
VCSQTEPPLEDKHNRTLAACHFPLTREEVNVRLPTALIAK